MSLRFASSDLRLKERLPRVADLPTQNVVTRAWTTEAVKTSVRITKRFSAVLVILIAVASPGPLHRLPIRLPCFKL